MPAAIFGIFGGYQLEVNVSEAAVNKMNLANFIFLSISLPIGWRCFSQKFAGRRQDKHLDERRVILPLTVIVALTAVIFIYSFLYHGNWRQIPLAFEALTVGSTGGHYDLRRMMRYETGGLWIPGVFSDLFMIPAIFYVSHILKQTRKFKYLLILISIWAAYLLFNLISLQRSPVAYAFIILILALVYIKIDLNKIGAKKLLYLVLQFSVMAFLLAAGIYFYSAISMGGNFLDALLLAYRRLFLIPTITPLGIFEVFPDVFDFRGLFGVFHMGVYTQGLEIGFADVGYMMTGKTFSPNSYFLGVGFSGMGLLGVLIVSFVFSAIALFADQQFAKYSVNTQFLLFACSFVGIMALTSVPLFTAIRNSGFIVSSFGFLFLLDYTSTVKR